MQAALLPTSLAVEHETLEYCSVVGFRYALSISVGSQGGSLAGTLVSFLESLSLGSPTGPLKELLLRHALHQTHSWVTRRVPWREHQQAPARRSPPSSQGGFPAGVLLGSLVSSCSGFPGGPHTVFPAGTCSGFLDRFSVEGSSSCSSSSSFMGSSSSSVAKTSASLGVGLHGGSPAGVLLSLPVGPDIRFGPWSGFPMGSFKKVLSLVLHRGGSLFCRSLVGFSGENPSK